MFWLPTPPATVFDRLTPQKLRAAERDAQRVALDGGFGGPGVTTAGAAVYLLWHPAAGLHKIGKSNNVQKRINMLRFEHGGGIELYPVALFPGAHPLERALHHLFRDLNVRNEPLAKGNEWFDLSPQALGIMYAFVGSLIAAPAPSANWRCTDWHSAYETRIAYWYDALDAITD